MNLIEFPEMTTVIAKDQPEYNPLPAHRFKHDPHGRIACCWKITIWERIKLLFTGKIWHEVLTFNQSLQPQLLSVDKPIMQENIVQWACPVTRDTCIDPWCMGSICRKEQKNA